jgi:putative ABC transport system permease protein
MRIVNRVLDVLRGRGRGQGAADLDEELDAFFAASVEAKMAAGATRAAAERQARIEIGSRAAVRDWVADVGVGARVAALWSDVRFSARVLRRAPAFLVVAVVTLALGTGANAAIFQLLDAVRFQTLPVEQPGELVSIAVDRHGKPRVGMGFRRGIHTVSLWEALRTESQAFASLLAWGTDTWDLSATGAFQPAQGLYVSGGYFDALGVRPYAGRLLTAADDHWGCGNPGVVLSHAAWQTRYGADPRVVGRTITLNRRPFEVVGVAPPEFFGVEVGRSFDAAVPLCAEPLIRGARTATRRKDAWWLDVMGRLKPGWTAEQASAHLAVISPGVFDATLPATYDAEAAANYRGSTLTATPAATGVSTLRTQYATHLWLLFGGTALVLLITCANLANLMLARASARGREVALRLAIGASRGCVLGQMLVESLMIAGAGVAAGLVLANWLSRTLVLLLTPEGGRIVLDLQSDWRLFAFGSALAVGACVLFGLSPALRASGTNPGQALQPGGRSGTESREALGLRRALVVSQIAISLVLVVAALLFARSLRNLTAVDLGFQPGVVAATIDLNRTAVPPDARLPLLEQIVERVRAVPGVRHAAETFLVPLGGSEWNGRIALRGTVQDGVVYFNSVGADYFTVLNTPVLSGRAFGPSDAVETPKVAVVNEAFAKRYLRGGDPVGQSFEMDGGNPRPSFEVVGVVRDTKYLDVREGALPIAYVSIAQDPRVPPLVAILVQSDTPLAALAPTVTAAISGAAPGVSVSYSTIDGSVRALVRTDRVMTLLTMFFGLLAVLIAVVGLYGVMSYMVTRRRAEIGIRMALGADQRTVRRMMLRESGLLLLLGATLGLLLAAAGARYAEGLLYGVTPWDPASFALAAGVLGSVGLLAAWVPARRASRLDPTIAMRD